MAIFNPGVPETQPKDYRESRPISQGASSSLGGEAFKVAGDVISAAAKGGDQIVKDQIEKDIYATVDRERDGYTAALESIRDGQKTGTITGGDSPEEAVPAELQGIGDEVGTLRAAAQANKISNTAYDGSLLALAKDYRRKWGEAYRPYIDQKFSEASGIPIANSYAAGLLADINRDAAAKASKSDKMQGIIIQDRGFVDSEKVFAEYNASDKGTAAQNKVFTWSANNRQLETTLKLNALKRADAAGNAETQGIETKKDFGLIASQYANQHLNATSIPGGLSAAQVRDRVIASNNGTAPQISPEASQQYLSQVVAAKQGYMKSVDAFLYDTQGSKVKSPAMTLKPDELTALKAEYEAPFDTIIKSINDKDIGTYHFAKRTLEGVQDQSKLSLLQHPTLGAQFKVYGAINSIAPDFTKQWVANNAFQTNLPTDVNNYVTQEGMLAASYDVRQGEKPTVTRAIDAAIVKGVTSYGTHKALIDNIKIITDPKLKAPDDVKAGAAMYFFGPGNQNLLAKFPDEVRQAPGQPMLPGKLEVFSALTTDAAAEEIFRIGKTDKRVSDAYTNWTANQFSTQLFDRQIKNLSSIKLDDNLKLGFDPDRSQFTVYRKDMPDKDLLTTKRATGNTAFAGPSQMTRDTLNTLNVGMHSMATIGRLGGYDTNAYLFSLLANANPQLASKDSLFYQAFDAARNAKKPDPAQRGPR